VESRFCTSSIFFNDFQRVSALIFSHVPSVPALLFFAAASGRRIPGAMESLRAFICPSCASCIFLARVARTRTDSADSFLRKAVKEMKSVFVGELISE
jgi:hypothetical protein